MEKTLRKEGVPFVQVANEVLNSETLTFKAKGLYAFIASKPDGWQFSIYRIALQTKEGRDSVSAGLKELEDEGWLVRMRKNDGRVEYVLYNSIKPASKNPTTKPKPENPTVGKSQSGKIQPVSNKENIAIKKSIDDTSYEASPTTYKTKQKIYKQRGLDYKPKKSRFIEVGKVVEEFRAAASARGFNLLKSDGQRNKRIRGQIEALLIAGKDLKGLINWWFRGEGDYCGYAPENLFTERTVETYQVKNKKKEVKDTTPDFQKLKEKWKSQNKNQRKRS
jgi:hypothetical protein